MIEYYDRYPRQSDCSPAVRESYRKLLNGFEPFRKSNRILDVGCGEGFFLEEAKKMGWEVYGTEYSASAVDLCKKKNINVNCGALNSSWYPESYFDIVTSFEVIEHINNPIEFTTIINKILRSGGLAYITTPNFNALSRYILKDKYNIIEYPEHLCYYSRKTLDYLFTHNGFKQKRTLTTGISISRFQNSLHQTKPGEQDSPKNDSDAVIMNLGRRNWFFRSLIKFTNFFLNLFGIGLALKGWYTKA